MLTLTLTGIQYFLAEPRREKWVGVVRGNNYKPECITSDVGEAVAQCVAIVIKGFDGSCAWLIWQLTPLGLACDPCYLASCETLMGITDSGLLAAIEIVLFDWRCLPSQPSRKLQSVHGDGD